MAETITVSWSEIDAFRQCPFKHQLAYGERWVKPPKPDGALARGILWHEVLEAHYRILQQHQRGTPIDQIERMEQPADIIRMAHKDAVGAGRDPDTAELVEWMYEGYLQRYGTDPGWRVEAVEHQIVIPLWDGDVKTKFRLKCKLDLVVRDGAGRFWLVDHKSCSQLPKDKELDLDEQFALYTAALRRVGKPIFGSVYSAALTRKNKVKQQPLEERFSRTLMSRPDAELAMLQAEVLDTVRLMYGAANRHERHPNTDTCRWRCDYTEACMLGRRTNDNSRTRTFLLDTGWVRDPTRH